MSIRETEYQDVSLELIEKLRARGDRQTFFGHGIRTADSYIDPLLRCANGLCDFDQEHQKFVVSASSAGGMILPTEILGRSRKTLTYSNDETVVSRLQDQPLCYGGADIQKFVNEYVKARGLPKEDTPDVPMRSIMVFENVVTTPKEDRDRDILRTDGAIVDKRMPLLWQHIPVMPIGKMLMVVQHTDKKLVVLSVIIGVNDLAEDAAKMVEADMLRISHGFRPLKYVMREDDKNSQLPTGFEIQKFEVMEESLVSIPSNTDAVITMWSRNKFANPLVKSWAKSLNDNRPLSLAGVDVPKGGCSCLSHEACICGASADRARADIAEKMLEISSSALADEIDRLKGEIARIDGKSGRVLSAKNQRRVEKAYELVEAIVHDKDAPNKVIAIAKEASAALQELLKDASEEEMPTEVSLSDLARKLILAAQKMEPKDFSEIESCGSLLRDLVRWQREQLIAALSVN